MKRPKTFPKIQIKVLLLELPSLYISDHLLRDLIEKTTSIFDHRQSGFSIVVTYSPFPTICHLHLVVICNYKFKVKSLEVFIMLAFFVEKSLRYVFRRHTVLKVAIATLFQRSQKEFVCVSIETIRIWFVWITFRERVVVLLVVAEMEINCTRIDVIQNVVQRHKIDIIFRVRHVNDLSVVQCSADQRVRTFQPLVLA